MMLPPSRFGKRGQILLLSIPFCSLFIIHDGLSGQFCFKLMLLFLT